MRHDFERLSDGAEHALDILLKCQETLPKQWRDLNRSQLKWPENDPYERKETAILQELESEGIISGSVRTLGSPASVFLLPPAYSYMKDLEEYERRQNQKTGSTITFNGPITADSLAAGDYAVAVNIEQAFGEVTSTVAAMPAEAREEFARFLSELKGLIAAAESSDTEQQKSGAWPRLRKWMTDHGASWGPTIMAAIELLIKLAARQ